MKHDDAKAGAAALCGRGLICVVAAAATLGCSEDTEAESFGWLGDEAHLFVSGVIDGEPVELDIQGEEAAANAELYCRRDYFVDGAIQNLRVVGTVDFNGEVHGVDMPLQRHDFSADATGTSIEIVPRPDDDQLPGASQMWFKWIWDRGSFEARAQAGAMVLELYTGTPGDDGVIPEGEGSIGGTVHGVLSETESVDISFTVPCTLNRTGRPR